MTTARRHATSVAAALCGLTAALSAGAARAYTFVDQLPEDACDRARSFDPQDGSADAQHARRACRLAVFEARMAEERRRAVANQEVARDAWVQKWMQGTQPSRVINPMAIELFAGSGIVNYGVAFSWTVLRQLELSGRVGQRQMSCASATSASDDCTRTTWGLNVRWMLGDRDFTPFVGVGFATTHAPLKIYHYNAQTMQSMPLDGHGGADSGNASAGVQLAVSNVRLSVEYIFEYVFYTGANLSDMQQTPSEDLRSVWNDSLKQDRHGVRFQVGFAF
ncbi:MAG TPA: hypothetical protein VIF57_15900 [Polyangia bacterium]